MSIRVQCPNPTCGATHKVKDRYAGKRCLCPSCGKPFAVPDSTAATVAPSAPAPLPPPPEPAALDLTLPEKAASPARMPILDLTLPEKPKPAEEPADDDLAAFLDAVREEEAGADARGNGTAPASDDDMEAFLAAVAEDAAVVEEAEPAPPAGKETGAGTRSNGTPPGKDSDALLAAVADEEAEEVIVAEDVEEPALAEEVEEPAVAEEVEEAAIVEDDGDAVLAEAVDDDEAAPRKRRARDEEEEAETGPARHFSWVAALILLLGVLAIGVATAAVSVGGEVTFTGTGGYASHNAVKMLGFGRIQPEEKTLYLAIPAAIAGIGLLGLLVALITRRLDSFPMLTTYVAAVATAGVLFFAGVQWQRQVSGAEVARTRYLNLQASLPPNLRASGTLTYAVAPYVWTGMIAAGAALVLFFIALVLMHRRTWSRLVAGAVFLLLVGLVAAAVFGLKWEATTT